jgi:hypothetical protein
MVYYLYAYSQQNPDRFFTNYSDFMSNKKKAEVNLFATEEDAFNFAISAIPKKTLGIVIYQVTLKEVLEEDIHYLQIKQNNNNVQSPVYWSTPSSSIQKVSQTRHFAVNPAREKLHDNAHIFNTVLNL